MARRSSRLLGRGFITDGGGNGAIVVFDLKTYAVLGTLATMPDSDGIIYDKAHEPGSRRLRRRGALMTFKPDIDPVNGKIDPPIDLGGAPEFLAYDDAGKAYINLEDKDLVAVVDLKTRKVIARWPVAPGGHPVGMAIDRKTHRLFIGCRNPQKLIVMSTDDGKVLADLPIGAGVDATKFHAGQAFASCGDGHVDCGRREGRQVRGRADGQDAERSAAPWAWMTPHSTSICRRRSLKRLRLERRRGGPEPSRIRS